MITDISPSCVGPALDRILTLRPERGSLHSTIQARINTLTVLAEFLTSDEKDKSCRSLTRICKRKDTHQALFYGLENSGYFLRFLANLNSGQSQYRKENRAKTNQTSG